MFLTYLSYLITQFPVFLFVRIPLALYYLFHNLLKEIDNRFQFELNLRMFFVPLYGNTNWALWFVSILYRLTKAIFGLIFLIVYVFIYTAFAVLVTFSIPLSLVHSFELFVALLLLYFLYYVINYVINPYIVLNYSKNYYTLFEAYKMANIGGRKAISNVLSKNNLAKSYAELAAFLEIDVKDIEQIIMGGNVSSNAPVSELSSPPPVLPSFSDVGRQESHTILNLPIKSGQALVREDSRSRIESGMTEELDSKAIASTIISFGKMVQYRYIDKELVLAGFLNYISEWFSYSNLKNLPPYALQTYLVSSKHDSALHRAGLFSKDYESSYNFPYNVTKVDTISPTLNKYSLNFKPSSDYSALGFLPKFKNYRIELIKALDEGSKKVMVVGNPGTGKTSIIKNFFLAIQKGHVPHSLKFNRILSLDLSGIVSLGIKGPEVLNEALKEFQKLRNTILLLDNLHILFSVQGLDYLSILLPYLEDTKLKIICTADLATYRSFSSNYPGLDGNFKKITIEEINGKELYDFLSIKNWELPKMLTVPAIEFLVESTPQVLFDKFNPQKSLSIIESASQGSTSKYITKADLAGVVKNLTGISLGDITKNESDRLLNLEEKIKQEVIGQNNAVSEVVNSLIRSRGARGTSNKPIASFLFAGPTGVGKTELAKALARNYFGGEKNIIRLDMSEYQTPDSINRLIGSENGTQAGILTQQVKDTPFNLLLLDEIEKASSNIHMLFLQVLDDGRLTDATGSTVYFKNMIIIATTNAGTENVIQNFSKGLNEDMVRKAFMQDIKHYFPPEFLNRFSEIVLFKPLNKDILEGVLNIKFEQFKEELYRTNKINVELAGDLKDFLMQQGYSKEWGARHLERAIDKIIKTPVSKAMLKGEISAGSHVVLDKNFILKYS